MLLLIDNYDSFTYNLAQYLRALGQEVRVERNDSVSIDDIEVIDPEVLVISPGPCTPNEAGVSLEVVTHFAGKIPILGVCLGHQSIGQAFGAEIVRAPRVMHGKTSKIFHDERGLFAGIQNPIEATRYHSLVIDPDSLPDDLEVTAKTWDDDIMGVRHRGFADTSTPIEGVQFHPESIMSPDGRSLLGRFLDMVAS